MVEGNTMAHGRRCQVPILRYAKTNNWCNNLWISSLSSKTLELLEETYYPYPCINLNILFEVPTKNKHLFEGRDSDQSDIDFPKKPEEYLLRRTDFQLSELYSPATDTIMETSLHSTNRWSLCSETLPIRGDVWLFVLR
jgi:hypothetical protein